MSDISRQLDFLIGATLESPALFLASLKSAVLLQQDAPSDTHQPGALRKQPIASTHEQSQSDERGCRSAMGSN